MSTQESTKTIEVGSYSVIYTADWNPAEHEVKDFAPPKVRKLWDLTEGDEQADYDEMGWTRHRKWVALLTPAEFVEFVEATYLIAEDHETMGSIGAPGYGVGWAPAIPFSGDNATGALQDAYVTPNPKGLAEDYEPALREDQLSFYPLTDDEKAELHERLWQRLREQVLDEFGYSYR